MSKNKTRATAVVVNDDPIQLNILSGLLKKADIEPSAFEGAEAALTAMDPADPPELIVTDLYMPGIDGWRFCRLLRSPEYDPFNTVPILVVSATFAGDHAERIAADIGADAFLPSPVDGKEFTAQARALLAEKEARRLPRALIVEDSKALAGLLQKILAAHGYLADTAFSVREAEDAFTRTAYDVAVLDYHLPDSSGDVLLDAFRAARPDCVCLMMTTDPTPGLALSWMKRGAAAYLRKPFEPDYLIELCARARRERALLRAEELLDARTRELRESEAVVRNKLKAILEPQSDLGDLELADIIDVPAMQSLLENFHRITGMASAIVDHSGKVLVGVGWQDICTRFHRRHPETQQNCLESDTLLAGGEKAGEFKTYRCKNGMWDMASPIEVAGWHMGNIYFGQFLYTDEEPDVERFRDQARRHGFDETEYLAALDRVPRYDRETVRDVMDFYSRLGRMISSLSFSAISLSRTLTERKRAEEELRESEERYRRLTERVTDYIYTVRIEGGAVVETRHGPGCRAVTGYTEKAFHRDPYLWLNTVPPEDRGRVVEQAGRAAAGEAVKTLEHRIVRKDGRTRWVSNSPVLQRDEQGLLTGYDGLITDITERKRAEEEKEKLQAQLVQAQKMESVGRLAGGVAHDFNNMLGVILGHTELALEQVDPAQPIHADLQEVRKAAERSADLTRQLLAFARKQTVAPKVIDLNKTVSGMLKMLQRLIGEDIDLAWLPGKALGPVNVDPSQIDQILANLCVNARDAIAGVGKVTIETGAAAFDEAYCAAHAGFVPGDYVLLAVSDSGCGMDAETLGHLFEPFFTTKELGRGTGLGLAMVYGAVKQNKGFINVYSEPGQGTTFKIYLPRHLAKADRPAEKKPDQPAGRGHETILLVEDEPMILRMTTMMLERLGYAVIGAKTPGEAIRLANEHAGEIHLLMTDVVMPEMNGRDLAGNILSLYPGIKRLFMSGYTANVIAHHGVLDQGVNFIQKPFSMKDLAAKVPEVLDTEE
jgi:PAS domain S-box-containing protein